MTPPHQPAATSSSLAPFVPRPQPRVTKREVIRCVLNHEKPPYVPWHFGFTLEARQKLEDHFGTVGLDHLLHQHLVWAGDPAGSFTNLGGDFFRDPFGVVWDRHIDADIGVVSNLLVPEPTLGNYRFPDPRSGVYFDDIPEMLARQPDCYRVFPLGFSLYERAWTLRGMENLMADFIENPGFVRELLHAIADFNIAQVRHALDFEIDAVCFGDDWGQQQGLQMGPDLWHEFIEPELKRMYDAVHAGGKQVFIHSCGDVDELFDDLIADGVNCFNPFQPEVMDVHALVHRYRRKLTFFGGLSTQRTLPYGSTNDVRAETRRLIALGRDGGYILAPAHAVEGDVPLENMLAFIEETLAQPGFQP